MEPKNVACSGFVSLFSWKQNKNLTEIQNFDRTLRKKALWKDWWKLSTNVRRKFWVLISFHLTLLPCRLKSIPLHNLKLTDLPLTHVAILQVSWSNWVRWCKRLIFYATMAFELVIIMPSASAIFQIIWDKVWQMRSVIRQKWFCDESKEQDLSLGMLSMCCLRKAACSWWRICTSRRRTVLSSLLSRGSPRQR